MSIKDIEIMLDKDRLEFKDSKSRKVRLTSIDGNNSTILFNSISSCIKYLNNIASSNKTTLYSHIESGKPYQGYICQWDSEETLPIKNKSIKVNVTNVSTGVTETFDSYRKAALYFEPEYITTGSTIKTYAENGKLFMNQYKITILT